MKYVYVCTSSCKDFYLEQTFASIVTLKKCTPNAIVVLIVDNKTNDTLVNERQGIKKIVDELIVERFSEDISMKVRSRLLKTKMRNLVTGDFLYIDGDTFIFQDLSIINEESYEIAGIQDKHCPLSESDQFFTHFNLKKQVCQEKSFLQNETYINGGVLFVRDTEKNHLFFEEWNKTYLHFEKKGITQDMPSLALVNHQNNYVIKTLSGEWNCQLESGAQFFHSVKILHYFASHSKQKSLETFFKKIRLLQFNDNAINYIRKNYENAAFDFGNSILSRGVDQQIQKTAFYRFLVYLFSRQKLIFYVFEKFFSLGRGKGFYFKSK